MGLSQSSGHSEFVEPLAYGFEEDVFIIVKKPSPVEEVTPSAIKTGACATCVRRTKSRIQIENSALERYYQAGEQRERSSLQLEAATQELEDANTNLKRASHRHGESAELLEIVPKHIRLQLREAYQRRRMAIVKKTHADARFQRKEIALGNVRSLHENAKRRTIDAMNMQIDCAQRCSRRILSSRVKS